MKEIICERKIQDSKKGVCLSERQSPIFFFVQEEVSSESGEQNPQEHLVKKPIELKRSTNDDAVDKWVKQGIG